MQEDTQTNITPQTAVKRARTARNAGRDRAPAAKRVDDGAGTVNVVAVANSAGECARAMLAGLNSVVASRRDWLLHLLASDENLHKAVSDLDPDLIVFVSDPGTLPARLTRRAVLVSAGTDQWASRGIPSVDVDDTLIGTMAAQHFLERGLRNHAVFGFWHLSWSRERAEAFRSTVLATAGTTCDVPGLEPGLRPKVGPQAFGAPDDVKAWLRALPKPVGVFTVCDAWGRWLSNLCRLAGVRVPEDVALLGVDNDAGVCELAAPPLSSIDIPWRHVGREAGLLGERLLSARTTAGGPRGAAPVAGTAPTVEAGCRRIAPAGIFVRRSSDTLAVDDADVATALAVIHEHADRPLSVAQILKRVPATQHRLERQFKRLVGRRMTQEVRRVHVERARRLLSTTDLPMPDVARGSGFTSASKMAVAFHAETGQTPSDYRRRTRIAT